MGFIGIQYADYLTLMVSRTAVAVLTPGRKSMRLKRVWSVACSSGIRRIPPSQGAVIDKHISW
jgi:hypothetical protein